MIPSIDSFLQCAAGSHHLKALPVQSPLIAILLFKCLFLPILSQALSQPPLSPSSSLLDKTLFMSLPGSSTAFLSPS